MSDHDVTTSSLSLNRRDVLRAAAIGAALAAAAAPLAASANRQAGAAAAAPAAAVSADCSNLPLLGGPEFPIGIFWPPPPFETNRDRYQEIRDAGFTFVVTGNYLFDEWITDYALTQADQAGLQVLVADDPGVKAVTRLFTISDDRTVPNSITVADARTHIQRALGRYSRHVSFAGFNLFDEPFPVNYPTLGKATQIVRELGPTALPYSNLLPGQGPDYDTYVGEYVKQTKPPLISFDRYPLLSDGNDDLNYFQNWVQIRKHGLTANLPTWVYIQSLAYNNHRSPTKEELLWQINVSLAYGAKGIQYFTYWTPDPARGEGFQPALLTVDGQRTARYDYSKEINTSWLPQVGRQLKPLVSELVVHANETPLPPATTGFTPDAYLRSVTGGAVILGRFASPDSTQADTRWLLVANRSHKQSTTVQLRTEARKVRRADRFDPGTNSYVELRDPSRIPVTVWPGAATLLRLRGGSDA